MRVPRQPVRQAVQRRREERARRELVGRLRLVAVIAVLAAAAAAVVSTWDRLFPVAPEKLLTVYWTHDCGCVFAWMASLESDGFIVRDFEIEDLRSVRHRLGTPGTLHGCHVAAFMEYFVEGHVRAAALRKLAIERPEARGVVLSADVSQHSSRPVAQADTLLLFDNDGSFRRWSAGTRNPAEAGSFSVDGADVTTEE